MVTNCPTVSPKPGVLVVEVLEVLPVVWPVAVYTTPNPVRNTVFELIWYAIPMRGPTA